MDDREELAEALAFPLLGGIGNCLRFIEELIVMVSGPLLTFGLGIGLVALLSDGALIVNAPWVVQVWAIAQTLGVDGQLVGMWHRVRLELHRRRRNWAAILAYIAIGTALAYVAYVAALIFAYQEAYHLTVAESLQRLGMDSASWLWQRSLIAVFLVCLSGFLRYRPHRKAVKSADERAQDLQDALRLGDLEQQLRAQKAQGAVGLVRGVVQAARSGAASGDQADTPAAFTSNRDDRDDRGTHGEGVSADAAAPLAALPMAWGNHQTAATRGRSSSR